MKNLESITMANDHCALNTQIALIVLSCDLYDV